MGIGYGFMSIDTDMYMKQRKRLMYIGKEDRHNIQVAFVDRLIGKVESSTWIDPEVVTQIRHIAQEIING